MNEMVEVQDPSVLKLKHAIGVATQCIADAEACLDQLRARRKRALVVGADADQQQLRDKRKKALAKGDEGEVDRLDAELDKIVDQLDAEIAKAEKAALRARDRLQVLNEDLTQAITLERQREMDALYARADAARKIGESLILKEYAEASAKIVDVFTKLVAIKLFIRDANAELEGTTTAPGDSCKRRVAEPNDIRRIPDVIIPATTREVERCTCVGNSFPRKYVSVKEIEEVPEKRITGSWRPELSDSCEIASAMESSPSWSNKFGDEREKVAKRYQDIISALL